MYPAATDVLFIDIETVPEYPGYTEAPNDIRLEWERKCSRMTKAAAEPCELYSRAGIYAEFGKIICISSAWFEKDELRSRSCRSHNEKVLLEEFASHVNSFFSTGQKVLCAHNGKEFDFPYIGRRMLINGIPLPSPFMIAGKKPWEIRHLDTMELWKFGDYKNYTSLSLLAALFGLPSPKDDIDGSLVGKVYWEDKDLERIAAYCEKDARTVAQLYLKLIPGKVDIGAW